MDPDLYILVKCTIFWLNTGLRIYFILYAQDLPNSNTKFFFCTGVVKKHIFTCFKAMCTFLDAIFI